jgi:tetratricopeptide (TPR) repeat protein
MQDKWTKEEVGKIEKLLCSGDYKNVALGVEFIQQKKEYIPFIPVFAFLKAQKTYSLDYDLDELVDLVEKEDKYQIYWDALKIIHAHWDMDNATYLEKLKLYEQYKDFFEGYIQYNPEYAHPYRRIAKKIARDFGDKKRAAIFFESCLQYAPNYADAHFDYAFMLDDEPGNGNKIVHHYKQALLCGLEDRAVRHNMGRAYTSLVGDRVRAEAIYRENIQKYPNFHYSMIELASLVKQKNPDEAEALFKKAIEIDPKSDLAYNNLAFFYWSTLGEYDKAYKAINKALEIESKHALYWHTLAEVEWYGYQHADKALEALEKAKEVDPSYTAADEMIQEIQENLF